MSRLCDVVELITYLPDGTPQYRQVYAVRKPIPRNEFFAAGQGGIRPAVMFEVWAFEYAAETALRHEGLVYSIYRAYGRVGERTELYCEVRPGGH